MIEIGMFAETCHDKRYPSIFDSIHEIEPENKDKILYHLKHGLDIAYAPGHFVDVIDGKTLIKAVCYTDGVYSWRSDVPYYYEHYNIDFPQDFIEYATKNPDIIRRKVQLT